MIGQTVQHYKITAKLGAGGMGEVFLAEDTRLKRKVALKFLPQHFSAHPDARARFQREAEALAALNHPNIVAVHDVSEFEGRPFIAMEYVEGQTLKDLVASGDVDVERSIIIADQIAAGLSAAHEAKIVHRDIKSDNIVITPKGRVKIMDFGLVTWRGVSQLTQEGSTVGTMAYMSPEQAQGKAIDHRADLWSLGVVFYELLTGRLPFGGDHEAALAYSIMQDLPQPLARYCADAPPALQDVVTKALEKDPEIRYQSAAGFSADLKRARRISDSQIHSYAAQPAVVMEKHPRKKRGLMITAAVAGLVILVVLILRPWEITMRPAQNAEAVENRLAVMYFDNLADPEDAQRNGEIMANLLMSDLSGSSYLQVVSSQRLYDVLKGLGKEGVKTVDRETATQVARKAKARWMLTGSILRMSPNIVVTAQLVDVATGNMIASPRITSGAGGDIFTVVDDLSAEIKTFLSLPAAALAESDRAVTELTTASTDAYRSYLRGWEYIFQYQWRKAEEQFNKAIAADSIFAMAYYGLSWVATGRFDIQKQVISRARELSGGLSQIDQWHILAREANLHQRYDEAIAFLESIVEADPQDKGAYTLLSLRYRSWPYLDFEKSVAFLKQVLDIDPLNKNAYNFLAYDFERLGKTDSSLWAINKYIELAPNEPNPYDSRAELYGFAGNIDAAIASYRKALEVDSTYIASLSGLMRMHVLKRDYAAAERIVQHTLSHEDRAVRRSAREGRARIMLHQGRLAEYLERKKLARQTTELEFGSDLREMWTYFGRFYDFLLIEDLTDDPQWIDSAVAQFELVSDAFMRDSASARSDSLGLLNAKFTIALRSGDAATSRAALSDLVAHLDTTDYSERMRYGSAMSSLHFEQENYDSALAYALKFTPSDNSTGIEIWRGRLFFLAGQYGEAVGHLERAQKRFDRARYFSPAVSIRLHYWLGRSYEESGWSDKAIAQYEIFTEIWKDADPGITDLEDARARLTRLKTGS